MSTAIPYPVVDFDKMHNLVPAIIQDSRTLRVLMLGYMNAEAYAHTQATGLVTFYSRSKQRLWTKGEQSGHYLRVVSVRADCDHDTLLIHATPAGPVCHTGADTCFNEVNNDSLAFVGQLEQIIAERKAQPSTDSYTSKLLARGINKVAQKVGEEAVELVIEAKDNDPEKFIAEAADLLYHYLVLLQAKGHTLAQVAAALAARHKAG